MRSDWYPNFAFAFVQLANSKPPLEKPVDSFRPELREAQAKALKLPKSGMAVGIKLRAADHVLPPNKVEVGNRLGLVMRKIAYGEDLVYTGPSFSHMQIEGHKVKIHFKNMGCSLMVKDKYGYLKGFTITGTDCKWYYARAEISGPNEVSLYHPGLAKPVAVLYAWADNPEEANLYNEKGLPASPFRTDNWPGITDKIKFAYY